MKRLLIFIHYNNNKIISDYVLFILDNVKHVFSDIIFVSNSILDEKEQNKIKAYCKKIIIRENKGFDFGAWKDAILNEGWASLIKYDNITLMNDSCFGPLYDIEKIYLKMESLKIDFWGITNYKKSKTGMPGTNSSVPEHIQSYFTVYTKKVIESKVFQKFWINVDYDMDINTVIQKYETQLTKKLTEAEYKYKTLIDTTDMNLKYPDLATWHPDILLKMGSPFVKVKSFLFFPDTEYLKKIIKKNIFDIKLIENHFNQSFVPNTSKTINNKTFIVFEQQDVYLNKAKKIAIQIHVYYTDVFRKIINVLKKININYDLFISADSDEKKREIIIIVEECFNRDIIKEIIIVKNKGRDVAPWLINFNTINDKYDIIGHFHTKKTVWLEDWIGDSWMEDIIDTLIRPVNSIIDLFNKDEKIGIVIPDIPLYYRQKIENDTWGNNVSNCQKLWNRMIIPKKIKFNELSYPIMPYGNMYWYKPDALKPLFDLNFTIDNFPNEPVPNDGTIIHAIERLPVYIAWAQGYDFRIAVNPAKCLTGFDVKEKVENELKKIKLSKTYKFAKNVSILPKTIIRIFGKMGLINE